MNKKASYGVKRSYKDELEDSLDTSWLSESIQSPLLLKQKLDFSHILGLQFIRSNSTSLSISQSLEDISFIRCGVSSQKIIKASHDIKIPNAMRVKASQSFFRAEPRVVTLKKRTVPQNLLLDAYPRKDS